MYPVLKSVHYRSFARHWNAEKTPLQEQGSDPFICVSLVRMGIEAPATQKAWAFGIRLLQSEYKLHQQHIARGSGADAQQGVSSPKMQ